MKNFSLLCFGFVGLLFAVMALSTPALHAEDNGGGCASCCHAKATPTPTPSTNAPTKN